MHHIHHFRLRQHDQGATWPWWRVLAAALALVLAGCSAQPAPTPGAQPTAAASPAAPAAMSASGSTRTVTDALGNQVAIPANPQRVLALGDDGLLADLLDAGVRPVAATVNVVENPPGFAAGELDGIQLFPSAGDVSLETFVALQPDLIISYDYFIEEVGYDTLSQVAPTVAVGGDTPRDTYVQLMALLGKEAQARRAVEQLEQRIKEAGARLNAAQRTVSLATIYPGPNPAVWVDGPYAPPRIVQELGFRLRPSAADLGGIEVRSGRAYISQEQFGLLDGETIVLLQSPEVPGETEALQQIKEGPIWQTLPAVQNGRVAELNRLVYFGFRGEQRLLDDLVRALE